MIMGHSNTIQRFQMRATALYEPSQANRNVSRRYKRNPHGRDISDYQANEPAPTDEYFSTILADLLVLSDQKPEKLATMRRYLGQWSRWLKLGLSTIKELEQCVQDLLPGIASCWIPGAQVFILDIR